MGLAAIVGACSQGPEGPVGAPGGRDGIVLRYVSPRLQVAPAGAPETLTLAIEIRRPSGDGGTEPYAGARLEAALEEGTASVLVPTAVADARGIARFPVRLPGERGKSRLVVMLSSDPRSFLRYDVVAAPIVPIELAPGAIEDLNVPRGGALLRFRMAAQDEILLVPHQTDLDRTGVPYRFLNQAPGSGGAAIVLGADPITMPELAAAGEEPGDVVRGSIEPGGLVAAGETAPTVNIKSCRIDVDREAPLRYRGDLISLYVDAPPGQFQARIDSLGRAFDEAIFPTNTRLFGPTTDFDGNGRVIVVMSPELSQGGVYCDTIRTIGVEAFYAAWSPEDALDRPLGTLAHEHQHVINAGHHLRTDGGIGDERWLNEALSYAGEFLNGSWGGTMVRLWQFLGGQNNGLSMLPLEYAPTFNDEYMMFLLYLRDRFGPNLYLALGASGRTGVANIEAVTGVDFPTLLRDWFIASVVSGRGVTDDPRYSYRSIDLHGMAEQIDACRCVPPARFDGMALERLRFDRPFDVFRSLDRADADYYRLQPDPAADGPRSYDLYYDAFGRAAVKLTAVRVR